jgi:hypothetical protein
VLFEKEMEKDNCRLCYDVFCPACFSEKRIVPGHDDPQIVCCTCNLLLTTFPTFAIKIQSGYGGSLLPPGCAAIVVYSDISSRPTANVDVMALPGRSSQPDDDEEGGIFSNFFGKTKKSKENPSSPRQTMSPLQSTAMAESKALRQSVAVHSFSRMPSETKETALRSEDAVPISMVGWRPINPSTSIRIGDKLFICLDDIQNVHTQVPDTGALPGSGNSPSLHPAASPHMAQARQRLAMSIMRHKALGKTVVGDGRVVIELRNGECCHVLIGTARYERDSEGAGGGSDQPSASVGKLVDFTSDPETASQFAKGLKSVVKHCRGHFAFSSASMALHADMCPDPRVPPRD